MRSLIPCEFAEQAQFALSVESISDKISRLYTRIGQ
jgi:hypothetical protein